MQNCLYKNTNSIMMLTDYLDKDSIFKQDLESWAKLKTWWLNQIGT